MKIKDVIFLTPARVVRTDPLTGIDHFIDVEVDLVNRAVFTKRSDGGYQWSEEYSKAVFNYLEELNGVPGDFFAPPPEVTEQAESILEEHSQMVEGDENA